MDRVDIPVYSAVVPRSADVLSVYNGKGSTREAAHASAVMEAVERFSASLPRRPVAVASQAGLAAEGRTIVDPADVSLALRPGYGDQEPISWVSGVDLVSERAAWVPKYLAGYYVDFPEQRPFELTTTNGLASGNSIEEAIRHGLCELIERHDWTLADLVSNRLARAVENQVDPAAEGSAVHRYLAEKHPSIDLRTLPSSALALVERFDRAGLRVQLKSLVSDLGIATVLAVVAEDVAETFAQSHWGLGADPDAQVAVVRALTEVAQSRAVDISGVREDIELPGEPVQPWQLHAQRNRRVDKESWAFRGDHPIPFDALPTHPSDDIRTDIDWLLERLVAAGLHSVIVVDLSPRDVPAAVVRVIVPGLESWVVDHSKLGRRALDAWNTAIAELRPRTAPLK